jgi:hypothetical protein
MWESLGLILLIGGAWFWADSLRARERALDAGRRACERYGVQFLDETVAGLGIRIVRDEDGRLMLRRNYRFEFSATGNDRRLGTIVMAGAALAELSMEPYPAADAAASERDNVVRMRRDG